MLGSAAASKIYYAAILKAAIRAADPFVAIKQGWLIRRLGPYCSRIDLDDLPKRKDERVLLRRWAPRPRISISARPSALSALRRDLKARGNDWLRDAARRMAKATLKDWKAWRAA